MSNDLNYVINELSAIARNLKGDGGVPGLSLKLVHLVSCLQHVGTDRFEGLTEDEQQFLAAHHVPSWRNCS